MKKATLKVVVPVTDMKEMGRTLRVLGLDVTHCNYIGTDFYSWIVKGGSKYDNLLEQLQKVSKDVKIT